MQKREKQAEKVLLYQFEGERLQRLLAVFGALGIAVRIVPKDCWRQKIGFLLHIKGFLPSLAAGAEPLSLPREVMLLHNIKGERLDEVLRAFRDKEIGGLRYKALVTPTNRQWSLGALGAEMAREYEMMRQRRMKHAP